MGAQLAAEKHASLTPNPVARALGLDEPNGPSVVLEQAMKTFGSGRDGEEVNVLYLYMLDAWEKVFENELDQATFEEHMRWFFRTKVGRRCRDLSPERAVVKHSSALTGWFVTGLQYIYTRSNHRWSNQAGECAAPAWTAGYKWAVGRRAWADARHG